MSKEIKFALFIHPIIYCDDQRYIPLFRKPQFSLCDLAVLLCNFCIHSNTAIRHLKGPWFSLLRGSSVYDFILH